MKEGLLWFDDHPGRDLIDKVGRAAERYRLKFGRSPNVCYVNPTMVNSEEAKAGSLLVLAARTVLPNHFWVGVLDARKAS
jgi:hypothetical protein